MPRKTLDNIKFKTPVLEADIEILPYETTETDQLNQAVYLAYGSLDMKKAMEDSKKEQEGGSKADGSSSVVFENLPASAIMEIKNNAIKGFVVSIDGNNFGGDKDALLEDVLKLPKEDYDEIQRQIDLLKKDSTLDPKGDQTSPSDTPKPSPAK